jgi:hypothetical protein
MVSRGLTITLAGDKLFDSLSGLWEDIRVKLRGMTFVSSILPFSLP